MVKNIRTVLISEDRVGGEDWLGKVMKELLGNVVFLDMDLGYTDAQIYAFVKTQQLWFNICTFHLLYVNFPSKGKNL